MMGAIFYMGEYIMRKDEFIKRYGLEAYEDYKKKQSELARLWREKNREKSRKYGREYYYKKKKT